MSTDITAWFGTKPVSRAEVLQWESKRAGKALRQLGQPVPDGVEARRSALVDAKLAAGREAIEARLARQIALSDRVTRAIARGSGRRRRLSQVELFAPGIEAERLPAWYFERALADDEAEFLRACPDHHLFRPRPGSLGQEVWETTGGSPIASRFFFTLGETDEVVTQADPSYPVQMVGLAKLADGTTIGAIRHQFRDESNGARALLTVEMPWLIGPIGPRAHRWHLACEFSAWFEYAAASS